ncbi:hypothetical protein SASPL_155621 [Salvia splendens]|uniref:Uncharacterized protein n=1 Tax=Salvia splendens TaxID=180675 RepID=A0A8X8VY71_SALSN|nr:hypothetical protein SASPL_155621 [Salvia splendens]
MLMAEACFLERVSIPPLSLPATLVDGLPYDSGTTSISWRMRRLLSNHEIEYFETWVQVSKANKVIVPAVSALKFPSLEVYFTNGSKLTLLVTSKEDEANLSSSNTAKLPLTSKTNDTNVLTSDTAETDIAKASLISLSFRESSQAMVDSWTSPCLKAFAHSSDVRLYEVLHLSLNSNHMLADMHSYSTNLVEYGGQVLEQQQRRRCRRAFTLHIHIAGREVRNKCFDSMFKFEDT